MLNIVEINEFRLFVSMLFFRCFMYSGLDIGCLEMLEVVVILLMVFSEVIIKISISGSSRLYLMLRL